MREKYNTYGKSWYVSSLYNKKPSKLWDESDKAMEKDMDIQNFCPKCKDLSIHAAMHQKLKIASVQCFGCGYTDGVLEWNAACNQVKGQHPRYINNMLGNATSPIKEALKKVAMKTRLLSHQNVSELCTLSTMTPEQAQSTLEVIVAMLRVKEVDKVAAKQLNFALAQVCNLSMDCDSTYIFDILLDNGWD